jgi:hypothetical protein
MGSSGLEQAIVPDARRAARLRTRPDWGKLPAFNELVKAAFGPHGIIQDTTQPIDRELMGAPATVNTDDNDL